NRTLDGRKTEPTNSKGAWSRLGGRAPFTFNSYSCLRLDETAQLNSQVRTACLQQAVLTCRCAQAVDLQRKWRSISSSCLSSCAAFGEAAGVSCSRRVASVLLKSAFSSAATS